MLLQDIEQLSSVFYQIVDISTDPEYGQLVVIFNTLLSLMSVSIEISLELLYFTNYETNATTQHQYINLLFKNDQHINFIYDINCYNIKYIDNSEVAIYNYKIIKPIIILYLYLIINMMEIY